MAILTYVSLLTTLLGTVLAQPGYYDSPGTYGGYPGTDSPGTYGGYPGSDSPGTNAPPLPEPAMVLYPPMPYDIGALGEPCYNLTAANLEGLNLTPCDGELPHQICLGSKYFNPGNFLYQLWFRLENGTKQGFSKTNHGIWAGNPISFLATSNHDACKIMHLSDLELDLISSPPAVLLTETCTWPTDVVTQRIRYVWAPPPFAACTPQLVAASTPEVLASSKTASASGVSARGSSSAVSRGSKGFIAITLICSVVGVALLAGAVAMIIRSKRAVSPRQVPNLQNVAVNQEPLFNARH